MNDPNMDIISNTLGAQTPVNYLQRPEQVQADAQADYKIARTNIKELIDQGMETIPTMVQLMKEAQSDKMFAAGAKVLETLSNLNLQLSKLSKEEMTSEKPTEGQPKQTNIGTQHVYVGTTEALLQRMREQKRDQQEVIDVEVLEVVHQG